MLVDLPGWQRPIDPLTARMQSRVEESIAEDLDVVRARRQRPRADRRRRPLRRPRGSSSSAAPVVIVLNKVDRLKPGHIAAQMKAAAALGDFHALHPVSAKTGDGIDELRADLVSLLPEGPASTSRRRQVTDMPLEARIAELVREQALALTREEVPHALTAEVDRDRRGAASTSASTPRPRARR